MILLVRRGKADEEWWMLEVNSWLHSRGWQQGLGLYDHRTVSEVRGLLGTDSIHLTKLGKSIFANRLAEVVLRPLD